MTRKTNSNFLTIKQLLVFILAIVMCLSLFMAVACKESEDESADLVPKYSYTDVIDSKIKNPSFALGTQLLKYNEFPKTTVDGWTFSKVATSKSGVVDVSKNGWTELMSNFYKDKGMLDYVKSINNLTDNNIKEAIKNESGDPNKTVTNAEIEKYIINKYLIVPETKVDGIKYAFENPGKHNNSTDNKVYMLNNYVDSDLGYGCVQSVTSSTEITLKRGEYAKVSAWVKTVNLNTENTTKNYSEPIGANISVKNKLNDAEQANYGIYNIITNKEWQEYVFYIKADEVFESKFTLQLGLGYENYSVEGTAYFDNVCVEILTSEQYKSEKDAKTQQSKTISYNNKDSKPMVKASDYNNETNIYLYDMSIAKIFNDSEYSKTVNFHQDKNNKTYYDFTQYNNGNLDGNVKDDPNSVELAHKNNLDAPYQIKDGLEINLKEPASYTIKFDNIVDGNHENFKLKNENYTAITFFVKNNLHKLYSTNITINVHDIYNEMPVERPAVATISEANDEWTKYTITVKNNFDKDAKDESDNTKDKYGVREFYLEFVIGPDEYTDIIDNYALGTVTITSPIISTGATYQYADENAEISKTETDNYQYYKLLSETSAGTTALYADFNSDYTADETNVEKYSLVVSPSNIGQIQTRPADPKDYNGIESGHYYINKNNTNKIAVNNNPYAGLINSQYLDEYDNVYDPSAIKTALNHPTESEAIQPLMIKNNGINYGFISDNYTISANSYAKISVKVRVVNSKAYIYLVDTSADTKQVLKLDAFTVNTHEGHFDNYGETISKELFFVVNNDMLNDNGWATVVFYIATGATQKDFRIELWNGDRNNETTQNGYVFFNDIETTISGTAFTEPTSWQEALTENDSPLLNQINNIKNKTDLVAYKRELTDLEKKYNSENSVKISYDTQYVWAQTDKMIYAIYNTIDPIEIDPYATDIEEETTETPSLYETDPAAFWLSLSSIIIGVALIVAIIMLFIKNIRRRRKANKNDAKSHYTVRSRTKKPTAKVEPEEVDIDIDINVDQPTADDTTDSEQSLDSYVYGDVQDFGEEKNEND